MKPKALILLANGTNRDKDAAQALELAGAEPVIVPLKELRQSGQSWEAYQILVIPGGFSYADALGAGKLLALDLEHYFAEEATGFVARGKPVIGICNGFQALVKSGILPGTAGLPATLTFNASGHFECRWVTLKAVSVACLWTKGLIEPVDCPVAHGEGNFVLGQPENEPILEQNKVSSSTAGWARFPDDQVALVYASPDGQPANGQYPFNPNGSFQDIAGICNPAGNVLGLMPHPEDHVFAYQRPGWQKGARHSGLPLFQNGVKYSV